MRPYCPLPTPHFCWLKSSANDVGSAAFAFEFAFVLGTLALTVTLLLRLSLRFVEFELLVLIVLRFASATIITTRPAPMIKTAASPPRTHQITLDFFAGGALATGAGVHCGCCGGRGGGGGGGDVTGGRGLTTGGGG